MISIPAAAQSADGPGTQSALAVSPAIIEEALSPGKAVAFTLHVNNITPYPVPVKAAVSDFAYRDNDLTAAERARLDASKWFALAEPEFILQANQTKTVKGTITPPANAVPGGHYATIYFQPLVPLEALGPSKTYLSARVGVLAFLTVKGDITRSASYVKPLRSPKLQQRGPIPLTFAIKNTGTVHIMPQGSLTIRNWRRQKVASLALPVGIILPGATKTYTLDWNAPKSLGRYTAELATNQGNTTATLPVQTAVFWVLPWTGLLIVGCLAIGALLFIGKTRKRWGKAWRTLRGQHYRGRKS